MCIYVCKCLCVCICICEHVCACVWYGGGSEQLGKFPGQSTHLNAHAVNFVQEGDDQTVEVPQIEYKDPESHKPTLNEQTTTQNPCFYHDSGVTIMLRLRQWLVVTLGFLQNQIV